MKLLNEIKNLNNIYELFALCCSYVFIEIKKSPYNFSDFQSDKYVQVYDFLVEYLENKKNIGESAAFNELKVQVRNFLQPKSNVEKCFAIIENIDELIECKIEDGFVKKKNLVKFESLSDRYKDKVRIIPKKVESFVSKGEFIYKKRSKDSFELFRRKRTCVCSELDKNTVNYQICDENFIDKYPFMIHKVMEYHPIALHFKDRKKIVIAIFPFMNEKTNDLFDISYENKRFNIKKIYESAREKLRKRYISIYEKCIDKDIDFLIFPEMLLYEELLNQMERKNGSPQIIINGSIWKNSSNKSIVTNGDFEEIFSYYKKNPFVQLKKESEKYTEYTECLDTTQNREYDLLEIPEIGRVGVCICKDLIDEEVKRFHKSLNTSLLLVPAYTSSNDLLASARNLSEEFNCVVVVANSCSAISDNKKKIGFLTLPAKEKTNRTCLVKEYEKTNCEETCHMTCCGKIFTIRLDEIEQKEGVISFKINESVL